MRKIYAGEKSIKERSLKTDYFNSADSATMIGTNFHSIMQFSFSMQ